MHPAPLCWDLICSSERRFEHHNVRVVRGVVDRDALLATFGTGERVAGKCRCHHPVHQFDNLRLGRGKIDVRQAIQYLQHVEVVAQLPIALVGPHLRRQVWRIHNEHHPFRMAVLLEQLAIIRPHDLHALQIAVRPVGFLPQVVAEALPGQLLERGDVFPRKEQPRRQGKIIDEPRPFLFLDALQDAFPHSVLSMILRNQQNTPHHRATQHKGKACHHGQHFHIGDAVNYC